MALGTRIKEVREAMGLKQAQLCAKVPGLTQQNLSNLESRDSDKSEYAIRIADALGVSVRWLLDGEGEREDRDWPFRFERSRFYRLDAVERGMVEHAARAELERIEGDRQKPFTGKDRRSGPSVPIPGGRRRTDHH